MASLVDVGVVEHDGEVAATEDRVLATGLGGREAEDADVGVEVAP